MVDGRAGEAFKMIDMLLAEDRPKLESFRIETPMGALESDSGNHVVDMISVVGVIVILYVGKKLLGRYFR